jgi:hypothetical protein
MRLHGTFFAALALFGLIAAPLLAHHSVAKEFDPTHATTIQGAITKVEWMNPHAWITMETKNANGFLTGWRVEIAAPGALYRDGIHREVFELAKSCSMEIWPARDGSQTAYGRKLAFADGRSFDVHDRFFDAVPLSVPAK